MGGQEAEASSPHDLGVTYAPVSEPSEKIQRALAELVREYEMESDQVRRHFVRRFREAEEFWKGLQHIYWSERDWAWHSPGEFSGQIGGDDRPRHDSVTNIFQAFGLSIIAVLSQRIPSVRFFPVSAQSESDIATARAALEIAQLVERNNQLPLLAIREAYLLWTQGMFGGYVRYVTDPRFGKRRLPILGAVEIKLSKAGYECPKCVNLTEEESFLGMCKYCGEKLTRERFRPAETTTIPTVTGFREVANGQEVIDIVGALELKLPPYAYGMHDAGYLIWAVEKHRASLRAAYPEKAAKIGTAVGQSGEDVYERSARLSIANRRGGGGSQADTNLITYKRCWLRPWAFWAVDDVTTREELLGLYPDGCHVAFAGDTFLDARNESMDDCWRLCHAVPGAGMYTEPIGGSLVSVQKRFNTIENLKMEWIEYNSAPPILADAEVLNVKAMEGRRMAPGSLYPVKVKAGRAISDSIWQPRFPSLDQSVYAHGQELRNLGEFLTGAFPSLYGGELDSNTTATGYALSRNQAMGRIGLYWRQVKYFHAALMLLAVETFQKNRTEDVEIAVIGKTKDFESKFIRLGDLRGSVSAYPESDEDFPVLWQDIRATVLQLLGSNDPKIAEILEHPDNANFIKNAIGLTQIIVPEEGNRSKQFREIKALLPAAPLMDGKSGEIMPTILPDEFADDHKVHIAVCREWAVSDAGIEARSTNPGGYANVIAHGRLHQRIAGAQAGSERVQQGQEAGR